MFLMFLIGLEINLQDFRKQAVASSVFGLATFAVPMAAGVAVGLAFGYGTNAAILIGSLLASHTLLGLPVLEKFGLLNSRFALATIGATIFTDIAALLVLAVCLSVHISGVFSPAHLAWLVFGLAVYCVLVLGAIPWIGRVYLVSTTMRRRNSPRDACRHRRGDLGEAHRARGYRRRVSVWHRR